MHIGSIRKTWFTQQKQGHLQPRCQNGMFNPISQMVASYNAIAWQNLNIYYKELITRSVQLPYSLFLDTPFPRIGFQ